MRYGQQRVDQAEEQGQPCHESQMYLLMLLLRQEVWLACVLLLQAEDVEACCALSGGLGNHVQLSCVALAAPGAPIS